MTSIFFEKWGASTTKLALLFFVVRVVVFSPLSGGGVLTLLDLDKKVPAKISPLCLGEQTEGALLRNRPCFLRRVHIW